MEAFSQEGWLQLPRANAKDVGERLLFIVLALRPLARLSAQTGASAVFCRVSHLHFHLADIPKHPAKTSLNSTVRKQWAPLYQQ